MTELISITDLYYRPDDYPPDKPDILQGITLAIEEGAFIAIIGRNGSGKTTLIKHINGLLNPTQGEILVAGLNTSQAKHHPQLRSLVGMVFQNPSDQIVASTVEEDIAFGLENLNLPSDEIHKRVHEQLLQADLLPEAARPPHLLSAGQIQRVALAGVLARQPKIILFDEPTSMLDPNTRQDFLSRLSELHQQGLTILYITQHMEEVVYADKVVVIDQGQVAMKGTPREIFVQGDYLYEIGLDIPEAAKFARSFKKMGWPIPEDILTTQALLDALPICENEKKNKKLPKPEIGTENFVIEAENIHYTYLAETPLAKKALKGAELKVNQGVIQGIVGTNGSGKSTFLQHLNGILRPEKGQLRVLNLNVADIQTPLIEIVKEVGLVFQNPETQFFEVFVGDEIAFGPKQFNMTGIKERVRETMALVGLDFEGFKDRRLESLSGGEKRKVALASTLILDQQIMLFDEPTAGMDPQSRDELLELFLKLQNEGKTILIASHRLDEMAEITQYLSMMRLGKVIKSSPTAELIFDQDAIKGAGLSAPLIVKTVHKLKQNGWPIQEERCLSLEGLIDTLKGLMT